jgi:hypothetical protein
MFLVVIVENPGSILIYGESSTAVKCFVFGVTFVVFNGDAGISYPMDDRGTA